MRFHLLGLAHTKLHADYAPCAFTGKVRLLSRMLHERGHHVTVYAPEGSHADCAEMVSVLDDATFQSVHGPAVYQWQTEGFRLGRDTITYQTFARNAITEILRRAQPGDIVCATFGWDHKEICDAVSAAMPGLIVVESGIGYEHSWAQWRIFESAAWLHVTMGKEQRHLTPSFYNAIIPNAYPLEDYPYPSPESPPATGDYFLFVARPNHDKGLSIAKDIAAATGIPLYTAGQGTPEQWQGTHHLGVLGIEERNRWMAGARAVLCPSLYVEPWCNVAVEAQLNGTPVLATPWGAFTENIVDGVTGYRCHTLPEFIAAARKVDQLKRDDCRRWAEQYSLARIGAKYEAFFERLAGLYGGVLGDFYGNHPQQVSEVV